MRILGRSAATIMAMVASVALASSSQAAATPPPDDANAVEGASRSQTQQAGLFYTAGDNVHITNGDASGHGWWVNESSTATQADVTVQLQINRGGTWYNVGHSGSKRVYAGGGSANRAATRVPCVNSTQHEWRSEIDVDLVGSWDSPEKGYSRVVRLQCGA